MSIVDYSEVVVLVVRYISNTALSILVLLLAQTSYEVSSRATSLLMKDVLFGGWAKKVRPVLLNFFVTQLCCKPLLNGYKAFAAVTEYFP